MPSLFLHADDPFWQPQRTAALVAHLRKLGLLGSEVAFAGIGRYLAGHDFLKLLMFLGCSPRVALATGQSKSSEQMCFLRLLAFEGPVFVLARPPPAARCTQCRASAGLPPGFTFATQHRCGKCGVTASAADLDWRGGAGCGRFFIEVNGVYAQEAVPADKLLDELSRFSQCGWKYFFADSWSSAR